MDAFEKLLHRHRTSRFLVLDPEGGFGDQLILLGLEKKLQEMKIHYRLLKIRKSPLTNKALAAALNSLPGLQRIIRASRPDIMESHLRQLIGLLGKNSVPIPNLTEEVILLRGGAYLNDIWKGYGVLQLVSKVVQDKPGATVIISPQSFYFEKPQFPKAFTEIEQELHIFCRETESYKLLTSLRHPENVRVHLSADTAFYLSIGDFPEPSGRGNYVLIAPRLDRESVVKWRVGNIREWSRKPLVSKDVNLLPNFRSFVEIVANSSTVYTDRLHVSILAAILNKETYLLPNSYHKNQSTYGFSLKRFKNVRFIDTKEFPLPQL